jgi:hypothetical protein
LPCPNRARCSKARTTGWADGSWPSAASCAQRPVCSYALLQNGGDFVIAATRPPSGGLVIGQSFLVREKRGDERDDCEDIAGDDAVLSLLNQQQSSVRSYYLKNGRLVMRLRTYANQPPCDLDQE